MAAKKRTYASDPLGPAIEKLMAEKVQSGMDIEQGVGTTWLQDH